jgi:hypothetical protein
LIKLKNLDAAAKFTNANILTSGAGREKWQQARAKVLGNPPANETDARFNRTMLTFIQKCGATSESPTAENLRDFIMNAKKPSNLRFEDFKQRLEELDDYLPYLPGPLNQRLGDDQLFVTLKKCVPAWQKKYTDSNARKNIDNVNDLANYYGDLENQEKKEHNQDNQHGNRNSSRGQNRSQQRNRTQRSNESHYVERNNGNSDRRQGGSDRHNSRGRSSDNYRQGQGNQDRNRDNNRQDRHREDIRSQDNGNSQHRYNTRYQERRRENETHQIDTHNESNDGQDTYISNRSNDNASDNEFYFAHEKFHDTNKTNDKKENDEPVEDTDDESMISYAAEDNEDTELMLKKTY